MQYIANTKEFHIAEPTVVSIGKFDGLHCGHKKLVAEMMNYRVRGTKAAMFLSHAASSSMASRSVSAEKRKRPEQSNTST